MRTSGSRVATSSLLTLVALVSEGASLELRPVAEGLDRPVALAHAGDGSDRLFIVEQAGVIRILQAGTLRSTPFLDITSLVSCCGERGLLGLAFHPKYEANGYFYVNYTDNGGDTVIARYTVSADPHVADPSSAAVLLALNQPFSNHNGGHLAFGPAGHLFIAVGDGGDRGDPFDNGQNGQSLLGKILRIDVDGGFPYAIPTDNPFRFDPNVLDEIWAIGLRNPWRFSFDRFTGDLFIADVGQNQWEEVNFEPAASPGGNNYGWRRMEGAHCFNPSNNCNDGTLVLPILEYSHAEGCSITGGYRYRGTEMPSHFGTYFFGDFCSGILWGASEDENGAWSRFELLASGLSIVSFGEDEWGELYVADLGGTVYRLADPSARRAEARRRQRRTFRRELPERPSCLLELGQWSYTVGDTVRAPVAKAVTLVFAEPIVETKLWLEGPDSEPVSLVDSARARPARGARRARTGGPIDLFAVTAATPKGSYTVGCRLLDPVTGSILAEDLSSFVVE